MNELTFVEKIQVLIELLFSSPIIIGIFAFSLILMIILFLNNRLNKKIIKLIFVIIYVALIGFTVFKYGSHFVTSLDSFITLFMANLYFPTIPIYVLMMLVSFIIMIITLGSKKRSKLIKIINTIFFTLIQMLFAIFIFVIESNKIDTSSNEGIYTNEQTLTLLELGMGLFVIWIIILLIILYLKKADKIFKTKKAEQQDDFDEYINDYNEPTNKTKEAINNNTQNNTSKSFNNNVVQNLVPEFNLLDSNNEEVVTFDNTEKNTLDGFGINNSFVENTPVVDANTNNYQQTPTNKTDNANINNQDIFSNFEFIDTSKNQTNNFSNNNQERKNDDVEILDFDI